MQKDKILLGILGGLGPMSTVRFCELLTAHTQAECDRDHIDMIISSRASTPDRTAFILGRSDKDPLPVMLEEVHRLERAGADLIVIPCNTAHYFYEGLSQGCHVPMLNIIRETVLQLVRTNVKSMGLLATEGTVRSGAYSRVCAELGIRCVTPSEEDQARINSIIYDDIKQNKMPDMNAFFEVSRHLLDCGCERLVLGCTELSLLPMDALDDTVYVDSSRVLAWRTILSCGKTPVGFPKDFCEVMP